MRSIPRTTFVLVAVPMLFVACANERVPFDSGSSDARADGGNLDANTNDVRDSSLPRDTIVPPLDTGVRDTGIRDTGTPRPDVTVMDTGPTSGMCVSTCTTDIQCQNSCETPPSGYSYCCVFDTCTAVQGMCGGSSGSDGGTGFDVPLGFPDVGLGGACLTTPRTCMTTADCASCGTGYTCTTLLPGLPGLCSPF